MGSHRGARSGSDDLLGDLVAEAQQGARGETGARELLEGKGEMRKLTRKTLAISTAVALLAGGGAAFAYWTNSGTGPGTAATGTNVPITLTQTSTVTAMAPGIAAQALSGTFGNTNAGPVFVKTVVATVTGTEKPLGTPNPSCTSLDYTIGGTSVIQGAAPGVGAEVPAGALGTWSGLTIAFNNTASNQDACKNSVVKIAYTTTAS